MAANLIEIARHPKVVAIGEAGLDYHYDHSPRDAQAKSFRTHIDAAREPGCRSSSMRARPMTISRAFSRRRATRARSPSCCIASPSGAELARRGLALGGYVSFSGVVTFKNAGALRDIAPEVPEDRLLVETDAPYLAPEPMRGKTNEPAYVAHVAARLAALRGSARATSRA